MTAHGFEVYQEDDVVPSRLLVRIGVASTGVGAIGVLVAAILVAVSVGSVSPSFAGPTGPRPAASEISEIEQTPIWAARRGQDLRDQQRRDLERWGWVDRDAGVVRIPISRAMDLVVREAR